MTSQSSNDHSSLRRLALVFSVLTVVGMALSACNTTEGFGEDVEALGDSIDDAAEDAKD